MPIRLRLFLLKAQADIDEILSQFIVKTHRFLWHFPRIWQLYKENVLNQATLCGGVWTGDDKKTSIDLNLILAFKRFININPISVGWFDSWISRFITYLFRTSPLIYFPVFTWRLLPHTMKYLYWITIRQWMIFLRYDFFSLKTYSWLWVHHVYFYF